MRSDENDCRIRDRFFRSLGIIEGDASSPPAAAALRKKDRKSKPQQHFHGRVLSEETIEAPLKDHCCSKKDRRRKHRKNVFWAASSESTSESKENDSSQHGQQQTPPHSKIQFNSVVQIKTIPSHFGYSDRVRKHLWSNRQELKESQERNMREFAFEGWSVHHVIEEDGMYFDKVSHEFVHPVHVDVAPRCYY